MNNETDNKNVEHAYELSKWAGSIREGIYWLNRDPSKEDPVYLKLKEWVTWMINEGHRKSDDEIMDKSQELLPGITPEVRKDWIERVNKAA